MLRSFYLTLLIICIAPTIPGIVGVTTSAFSYIPPLDMQSVNFNGFVALFEWSGVWTSISLTILSTLLSAFLTAIISFSILSRLWHNRLWQSIEHSLSPLLAVPHVAFAIGLAFLLSPTGLLARVTEPLLSNEIFRWFVQDPWGIGLILMLTLKETPFLLLMSIPILKQLNLEKSRKVTSSLGYNDSAFWWKCVLPQWLSKIRFPMIAIIAYSASVVDVSLIIGPNNPSTFAVLIWQWFSEPDLSLFPRASAGAFLLFVLCTLLILCARFIEWSILTFCRDWQISGRKAPTLPGKTFYTLIAILFSGVFIVTLIWSFAQRWRFPDIYPSTFSMRFWLNEWPNIHPVISDSLILAAISSSVALLLAIVAQEYRIHHRLALPRFVIAIPILVPQLSLLFGMQVTTLYLDSELYYFWVHWSHVFFAFPYVYLSLDGPWSSYNQNYYRTALSLGKPPLTAWLHIKLPLLLNAVLFAWAIGASVSLAQYLPTLMLGGGRIATLTTEAVALSSGFDRRITAIYAIWQTLLPMIIFVFAISANKIQSIKTKGFSFPHESISEKPKHP